MATVEQRVKVTGVMGQAFLLRIKLSKGPD